MRVLSSDLLPNFGPSGRLEAIHTPASHRTACAQWRGLVQGGIPTKLAEQGQVIMMSLTKPCAVAGAIARVAHEDKMAVRKPAHGTHQQQPSHVRRCLMPCPVHAIPPRGAGPTPPRQEVPRAVSQMAASRGPTQPPIYAPSNRRYHYGSTAPYRGAPSSSYSCRLPTRRKSMCDYLAHAAGHYPRLALILSVPMVTRVHGMDN